MPTKENFDRKKFLETETNICGKKLYHVKKNVSVKVDNYLRIQCYTVRYYTIQILMYSLKTPNENRMRKGPDGIKRNETSQNDRYAK